MKSKLALAGMTVARLAIAGLAAIGMSGAGQAQRDSGGTDDPGARMPWDYPLPPVGYMLNRVGNPPNGKPPETKPGANPPIALLREAADAALAECEKDGLKVGVAALDAGGDLRVAVTAQNVAPGKVYIATRKGLTAIEFAMPSSKVVPVLNADKKQLSRLTPQMALFGGGVPLIRNGQVLGAVAASGATAEQDEHCAAVGAAKIMSRL